MWVQQLLLLQLLHVHVSSLDSASLASHSGLVCNVGAHCSFPLIHHGSSLQSVLLAMTESGTLKLGTKTLSWMCWRRPTPRSTGWSGYTRWVSRSWRSMTVGAVLHHAEAASHSTFVFPRSKIWTTVGSRGHKTFPQNSSSSPDELEKVLLYFCLG